MGNLRVGARVKCVAYYKNDRDSLVGKTGVVTGFKGPDLLHEYVRIGVDFKESGREFHWLMLGNVVPLVPEPVNNKD